MELSSCAISYYLCSIDPCVCEAAFVHDRFHELFDSLVTIALLCLWRVESHFVARAALFKQQKKLLLNVSDRYIPL